MLGVCAHICIGFHIAIIGTLVVGGSSGWVTELIPP